MIKLAIGLLALLTAAGCDREAKDPSATGDSWATLRADLQTKSLGAGTEALPAFARFVDAKGGSDETGDGLSASSAYRTIGRAVADVPLQVNGHWIIYLAAGTYAESVNLRSFLMPAGINNVQLKSENVARGISFVGSDGGADTTIVQPADGTPCFTATDVVLFLESLSCLVPAGEGISVTGSSVIFDDVAIGASGTAGNGIYAEDSRLYFGGRLSISGPFAIGMSLRVNTFARAGTRKHPQDTAILIDGSREIGIFLRDGGNLTAAFETGSISIANSAQGIYAILASRVFIPAGITLSMSNVGTAFGTTQQSFINAHRVDVQGFPSPFARCHKDSYILLEQISAASGRTVDTDGTCSTLVF